MQCLSFNFRQMANMSSIVEPASTGGINMTMDTSIIAAAAAVGAKRRKQTKVTQIQVIILIFD
jgi:hypothetical protein